jgi:hypothetical protein
MSCDAVLTRIELAADNAVLAEWSTDLFANLANCAVGVDCYSIISIDSFIRFILHTFVSRRNGNVK